MIAQSDGLVPPLQGRPVSSISAFKGKYLTLCSWGIELAQMPVSTRSYCCDSAPPNLCAFPSPQQLWAGLLTNTQFALLQWASAAGPPDLSIWCLFSTTCIGSSLEKFTSWKSPSGCSSKLAIVSLLCTCCLMRSWVSGILHLVWILLVRYFKAWDVA